jgi:hypothetical protein
MDTNQTELSDFATAVRARLAHAGEQTERQALVKLLVSIQGWNRRQSYPDLQVIGALHDMVSGSQLQPESLDSLRAAGDRASLYNERRSIPGRIRRLSLDSIRFATLLGVAGAILVACLVVVVFSMLKSQISSAATLPVGPVISLVVSGFMGSLVSIIIRIEAIADKVDIDPSIVFFSTMLRPIVGAFLALALYGVLASGLIKIADWTLPTDPGLLAWTTWVIGFIGGFSERLVPNILTRTEALLGDK